MQMSPRMIYLLLRVTAITLQFQLRGTKLPDYWSIELREVIKPLLESSRGNFPWKA